MTHTWFKFTAYNTETQYGFGTEAEATQYTRHLNKDRDFNLFCWNGWTDNTTPREFEEIGINLNDELLAIEQAS